jgi:phage gp29-like protein
MKRTQKNPISGSNSNVNAALRYRSGDLLSRKERAVRSRSTIPESEKGQFDEFTCSRNTSSGPKLTGSLIRNLCDDSRQGMTSPLTALYESMLEKDPAIAAHLQTRILSVLACNWSIQGSDQARVESVTEILQKASLHSLLHHLLDSFLFGYSGAAILWEKGGSIGSFRHIHASNWCFDRGGNPALRTLSGKENPLSSYHPRQFVFHTHKLHCGPCQLGGLLRPLLWLYFFKHYLLRDRARCLEKFGIPFLIARIREDDFENEDVRNSILNSLAKVGNDGAGVITEGSDLQILSPQSSGNSDYQSFLEYIDRLYALLILGQTASSSDSTGFSKGQIQENVRRDLLESDCLSLMETINEQIIAPLEYFRFGTQGSVKFVMDYSMGESMEEKARIVHSLAQSGYRIREEWIEKTFAVKLERKGGSL